MPTGCWISDYYLYVGDQKEMGILAEKKATMWIFSQIRNVNRDPGILYYRTGNEVAFRVFPFVKDEVRRTGIQFIHKEPTTINIDGNLIQLGKQNTTIIENVTAENENIIYVSSTAKKKLPILQRTPYYHFIVDVSVDKKDWVANFIKKIEGCLAQKPLEGKPKISYTNTYVQTENLEGNWKEKIHNQAFTGGFYLERAIKKALFDHYEKKDKTYPIFIVVTDDIKSSIIDNNFADWQITFPEGHLFYDINEVGQLIPHSLLKHPRKALPDSTFKLTIKPILAWPNKENPVAYLPNDSLPSLVLKKSMITLNESMIKEKDWATGLAMQGKWITQSLHPESGNKEWLKVVKYSFMSKIMSPFTSYIALENEAQKAMLKKKQVQTLAGNKALNLGEEVQSMSEPSTFFLLLFMAIFLAIRQRQKTYN